MIYNLHYFNKELRQAYPSSKTASGRKIGFAVFMGLLAFAIYFSLQSLQESVLMDSVPEIMQGSYFSTLYIYIHLALLLTTLYYLFYYERLCFQEIRTNSWYLLIKMGYGRRGMVLSKIIAAFISILYMYSIGFATTLLLTYFLRYTLVTRYFLSLYLVGLLDLFVLTGLSFFISSIVKSRRYARFFISLSAIAIVILKSVTHFYSVISNRITMQNIRTLIDFERSYYVPIALGITLVTVLFSSLRALSMANHYHRFDGPYEETLPKKVTVVSIQPKTGRKKALFDRGRIIRRQRAFDILTTSLLVLLVLAGLAFNVMVLLISASATGKEVNIRGTIPYVFKSTTMQPEIKVNDLAYFDVYDGSHVIQIGDILLFEDQGISYVERVFEIEESVYTVDIDHYPQGTQPDSMIKRVTDGQINGVYSGRNRWLGALILFANTLIGRLVLLLLPAFLLFYHQPIKERLFGTRERYGKREKLPGQ